MRVLIVLAGVGAGVLTYRAVRAGKLPPTGRVLAGLAGLQVLGVVIGLATLAAR